MSYDQFSQSSQYLTKPDDYFNLDSILSEQQRIICVFEKSMFGLGFLDVSGQNEHLISGTKMELPLWMALYLSKAKIFVH